MTYMACLFTTATQVILQASDQSLTPGIYAVGRNQTQRGSALLYIPSTYIPSQPAPILVMLHGAGGTANQSINMLQSFASKRNLIMLAPTSATSTWDIISKRQYGADVTILNQVLIETLTRCAIDPHLAVGGFSDGASYALSMGIINGELFSHILAFSPGFMKPTSQGDAPKIFVSHGIS